MGIICFSIYVFFSLYFIISAYWAFQLSPPTKQEKWFPDAHMVQRLKDTDVEYYGGDIVNYVNVDISWGIAGIDRTALNRWIPKERGSVLWDQAFSAAATSTEAHRFFSESCALLAQQVCLAKGCMDGSGLLTRQSNGQPQVQCFIDEWRAWLCADQARAVNYPSCANRSTTCAANTVPSSCVAAVDCHQQDGCKALAAFDELPTGATYLQSLADYRASDANVKRRVGMTGNDLKFLTIRFTSTLEDKQPQDSVVSVEKTVKSWVDARNAAGPAGLRSAFHSSDSGAFAWASTQQGLVDNVFVGFYVVFPCAFGTLLFATRNFGECQSSVLNLIYQVAQLSQAGT